MGWLLSPCEHETSVSRNRRMVKATDTHVYMESLEEAKDQGGEPNQVWNKHGQCMFNRQCPSELLADVQEFLYPHSDVNIQA